MLTERTFREVIIHFPASVDTTGLQKLLDYNMYKGPTTNSKATQDQMDELVHEVKKGSEVETTLRKTKIQLVINYRIIKDS